MIAFLVVLFIAFFGCSLVSKRGRQMGFIHALVATLGIVFCLTVALVVGHFVVKYW